MCQIGAGSLLCRADLPPARSKLLLKNQGKPNTRKQAGPRPRQGRSRRGLFYSTFGLLTGIQFEAD